MLDGWKTTIGSILAAVATALLTIDFAKDTTVVIVGKLLLAVATGLIGVGVAGKADKMTAAMNKPVEVVAASPAAVAAMNSTPPTDAQIMAAGRAKLGLAVLAFLVLAGCATSPQTSDQPATIKPQAELGQGRTSAAAAMYKSAATSERDAKLEAESRAVGASVEVPFALWSPETKSWQIPLDANGKPYMVTATAVRDFTYIVAGTVSNSATVSGTASGSQTQGGTAGATSGQTATPTTTVSPTTDVSIPVK